YRQRDLHRWNASSGDYRIDRLPGHDECGNNCIDRVALGLAVYDKRIVYGLRRRRQFGARFLRTDDYAGQHQRQSDCGGTNHKSTSIVVSVGIVRTNYTGSVTLGVGGLPAGVTASLSSPGTTSQGTITLTASSSATVACCSTITVTASGGGVTSAQGTFSLEV